MEPRIIAIAIAGSALAALAKFIRSRELSRKLGREVQDHELVSLSSWIEAEKKVDKKMNVKTCPKCRDENEKDAKFCSNCGHQFVQTPPEKNNLADELSSTFGVSQAASEIKTPSANAFDSSAQDSGGANNPSASKGGGLGCLLFLASLGVLGVLLFFVFFNSSSFNWSAPVIGGLAFAVLAVAGYSLFATRRSKYIQKTNVKSSFAPADVYDVPEAVKGSRMFAFLAIVPAAIIVLGIGALYIPSVRQKLIVHEHQTLKSYYQGGYGFSNPDQIYDEKLGPILLKDREVVENHLTNYFPGEAGILYAALRYQGLSNEEIFRHAKGKEMFVAALGMEFGNPDWTKKTEWLFTAIGVQPQPPFQRGLLDRETLRAEIQKIVSAPESPDAATLDTFIKYQIKTPGLLEPALVDTILEKWVERSPKNYQAIREILPQRKALRELAAKVARTDGTVETEIFFPSFATDAERQKMTEILRRLLALNGHIYAPGNQLKIEMIVEPRHFADVRTTHTEKEMKKVDEKYQVQVYRRSRTKYDRGYYTNENRTRKVDKLVDVTKYEKSEADVPTLVMIAQAGELEMEIASPPVESIPRDETQKLLRFLENPDEVLKSNQTARYQYTSILEKTAFAPWSFLNSN